MCGLTLNRKDRHIATVLSGIRKTHARPPVQKEAALTEDIIAVIETLDRGTLRGLRDRAMLLIGYTGGLRRSESVNLDVKADQTEDGRSWINILDKDMLVTLRGKTGWREVEVPLTQRARSRPLCSWPHSLPGGTESHSR